MIVRDQGKRFLERNEFQVEEESVDVGNEPLAALVVRCGPAQLRVLKGPDGVVPGCGTSLRRRRFYNQVSDYYRTRDGKVCQTRLNLILLWEFDKAFNLGGVWLVCPMRAGETAAEVVTFWHQKLPHPATLTRAAAEEPDARQKAEEELDRLLRDEPESDEEKGSEQA